MEYIRRRRDAALPGDKARTACADVPAVPNSSFLPAPDGGNGSALEAAMQAKLSALRRQIPAAEEEADRLAEGVAATSPEELKEEMGGRLGADFSSVRFHADASSAERGGWMGARAWTQGNDVYFGQGGFEPSIAAHELVHIVQQGAVSGEVSQSAPAGQVQMMPDFKGIKRWLGGMLGAGGGPGREEGAQGAPGLLGGIKNWFGRLFGPSAEECEAQRQEAERRAALKAQRQKKRPWEMSEADLRENQFNPGELDKVTAIQESIDGASSAQEAYRSSLPLREIPAAGCSKRTRMRHGSRQTWIWRNSKQR